MYCKFPANRVYSFNTSAHLGPRRIANRSTKMVWLGSHLEYSTSNPENECMDPSEGRIDWIRFDSKSCMPVLRKEPCRHRMHSTFPITFRETFLQRVGDLHIATRTPTTLRWARSSALQYTTVVTNAVRARRHRLSGRQVSAEACRHSSLFRANSREATAAQEIFDDANKLAPCARPLPSRRVSFRMKSSGLTSQHIHVYLVQRVDFPNDD